MREKIEILILKIFEAMPDFLKSNKIIVRYVGKIAEKRLKQVKQELLKMTWQKAYLEKDLRHFQNQN